MHRFVSLCCQNLLMEEQKMNQKDQMLVPVGSTELDYLVEERDEMLETAHKIADSISSQTDYERAALFLRVRCKSVLDEIDEKCKESIETARASLNAALGLREFLRGPLPEAMKAIEQGMKRYLLQEEERRTQLEAEIGVPLPRPEATGIQPRRRFVGSVTKPNEFLSWLTQQNEELVTEVVSFSQSALNKLAKLSEGGQEIPGFEAQKTFSIVKR